MLKWVSIQALKIKDNPKIKLYGKNVKRSGVYEMRFQSCIERWISENIDIMRRIMSSNLRYLLWIPIDNSNKTSNHVKCNTTERTINNQKEKEK